MKRITLALAALLLSAPAAHAQQNVVRMHVNIVAPMPEVEAALARAYDPKRERLWCVTRWRTEEHADSAGAYTLIVVQDVRAEKDGVSEHEITQTGNECRDGRGAFLPTIHTHPASSTGCQPSPGDATTSASRGTLFDGIQCGERFYVWQYSKQLRAAWQAAEAENMISAAP